MASVLLLSIHGEGISLAYRLAQEGHITKVYLHEPEARILLDGGRNPSKVGDPRKMLDQYDLVITDQAGLGPLCDELGERKPVIGGGAFSDKLSSDPSFHERVIDATLKMKAPSTQTCNLELQVEGWFNSKDWLQDFNLIFKHRRLMVGEIGPKLPCMGCSVIPITSCKLTKQLLEPLSELLCKVQYTGPVSTTFDLCEDHIELLGLRAGFGYDSLQASAELIPGQLFNFLYSTATGSAESTKRLKEQALAVRLIWNSEGSDEADLLHPIEAAKKHVWISDPFAKYSNTLAVVTSRGIDTRECQRRAYRTVQRIVRSSEVIYRTDIGRDVDRLLSVLEEKGWLKDAESEDSRGASGASDQEAS